MELTRATAGDIPQLLRLLSQVNLVHHKGRPDLFNIGTKYTEAELLALLRDEKRPVFVCKEGDKVLGYAFCVHQQHVDDNILTDIKTLYIDDICVDEQCRGKHVGSSLYHHVLDYAKAQGYYNVTLNVWSLNDSAMKFYEAMGLKPQKVGMETIL